MYEYIKLTDLLNACKEPIQATILSQVKDEIPLNCTPVYIQKDSHNNMFVMDGRNRLRTIESIYDTDEKREEASILCKVDYVEEINLAFPCI